jgi:hypothetical protein
MIAERENYTTWMNVASCLSICLRGWSRTYFGSNYGTTTS